ncbi:eukaryotic translation elongation factor 1 epsilon-1 isoform X1 [Panthera uncia]|uniref:eukaryotic translation elongation factor 1 epsilon-1 isoform X1 n=1 Tax=Panthera uncia TaxID=29064 RepID=UPI0020FFB42C|nr:eukaryotic translation elongation factor 1 epsilon-1 isoform X1 [Panthera uncia]
MAAAAELKLLEKSLGLSKGNKYSAQGERQIPVLQTNNGPSLTGLTTIAAHLVKQANKEYLLGSTAEEKAVVQQWLEYRVTRVDGHCSKDDVRTLLKDLNSYLEDKVYLTGYNFTLADILLYYGLHRFMSKMATRAPDIRVHDQEPEKGEERKGKKTVFSQLNQLKDLSWKLYSALSVYMSGHLSWEEGRKPSSLSHTLSSRIKLVL